MKNFIVSCDTCADMPKSWYESNGVSYVIMRRVLNGTESSECFDKDAEFDAFYDSIKRGELPTTTQVNPFEFKSHFEGILKSDPRAEIIHVSLSSGLSATCNNAFVAAKEVGSNVHVVDSLMGTLGIGELVCELVRLRDEGATIADAIEYIEKFKKHQHGWVIMSDLFHLKRGGRISPAKAAIGSILNIRPIIHISANGKLAMENKVRGNIKAIKYLVSRMEKYGEKYAKDQNIDFSKSTVWVVRTSKSELYDGLLVAVREAYPDLNIKTGIVGPIIGSHLGCGGVALLFHGAPRLNID